MVHAVGVTINRIVGPRHAPSVNGAGTLKHLPVLHVWLDQRSPRPLPAFTASGKVVVAASGGYVRAVLAQPAWQETLIIVLSVHVRPKAYLLDVGQAGR